MSKSISPEVAGYFNENPGREIYVQELVQNLGFTKQQIQNAMYNGRDQPWAKDIEVIVSANAWRKNTGRPARKDVIEFVKLREYPDGRLLLEDDKGSIYRAQKLDV